MITHLRMARLAACLTMSIAGFASAAVSADLMTPELSALANFPGEEFTGLAPMSDAELAATTGGFFDLSFNIVITPQFNICVLCSNVGQSNTVFVLGVNSVP